jgi:hypothetical protein
MNKRIYPTGRNHEAACRHVVVAGNTRTVTDRFNDTVLNKKICCSVVVRGSRVYDGSLP